MARKKTFIEDSAMIRASKILDGAVAHDIDLMAEYVSLAASYKKLLRTFHKTLVISDSYETEHQKITRELEEATQKYRQLKDVALPICMYCKKIRSDDDYWQRLETYFARHVDIMFSHGICPDCVKTAYSSMGLTGEEPEKNGAVSESATVRSNRPPDEDEALKEMRSILYKHASDGDPLSPEAEQFVEKYAKLLRRFNKIVTIGDRYQSQLMDYKSRLELMARTDLLTGLANRWEMSSRLDAEKSRSERHGTVFSILLGDLDHFKNVNDTYGHLAGDRVLRAIADALRAGLRSEDTCSRWGGEEFLIILPETDLLHAETVAKKLLKKVQGLKVPWGEQTIGVTISLACGEFTPGISSDEFIKLVDDALYDAKTSGRDRVVIAKGNRAYEGAGSS